MSATLYDNRITRDRRSSTLNVWLWIAQCLLAVCFLLAGSMHASMPIEQAAKIAAWIASAPVALVRFIGVAELATSDEMTWIFPKTKFGGGRRRTNSGANLSSLCPRRCWMSYDFSAGRWAVHSAGWFSRPSRTEILPCAGTYSQVAQGGGG